MSNDTELLRTAEKLLLQLATAGVDKLTELAPDMGWDSGEKVAEMYIRRLRASCTSVGMDHVEAGSGSDKL